MTVDADDKIPQQMGMALIQDFVAESQKRCFKKCFAGAKFVDSCDKNEHTCLAKCQDRMWESLGIVVRAFGEVANHLQPDEH